MSGGLSLRSYLRLRQCFVFCSLFLCLGRTDQAVAIITANYDLLVLSCELRTFQTTRQQFKREDIEPEVRNIFYRRKKVPKVLFRPQLWQIFKMTPDPKRETYLPHQLNGLWSKQNSIQGESASSETKVQGKNHAYRLGIPIKSSKLERKLDNPKQTSQAKYHKSYNIDQAGPGVIALKDTEKLPICLLKYSQSQKERSCLKLQFASHKNLVSLIDHFQSGDEVHLVYEYEHLAVTLGCVAGTVSFSEADIATICKEVLEGLKYVHTILRITYGMLDFSNILLTWQGEVKLGMFFL